MLERKNSHELAVLRIIFFEIIFLSSTLLDTNITFQNTPQKINIDTKNCLIQQEVSIFQTIILGIQPLVFGGVGYPKRTCIVQHVHVSGSTPLNIVSKSIRLSSLVVFHQPIGKICNRQMGFIFPKWPPPIVRYPNSKIRVAPFFWEKNAPFFCDVQTGP